MYNSDFDYTLLNTDNSYFRHGDNYYLYNPLREKVDVLAGLDTAFIKHKDGTKELLNDGDFEFDTILFPGYNEEKDRKFSAYFDDGNRNIIANGKYLVDLYVRYADETEYTLYESFYNVGRYFKDFPKKVSAYYFLIHDYDVHHFGQDLTRQFLATRMKDLSSIYYNGLGAINFKNESNDLYSSNHSVSLGMHNGGDNVRGVTAYVLFSEGIYIKDVKDITYTFGYQENIGGYGIDNELYRSDKNGFMDKATYFEYLENHLNITITNNWRNSNRQLLKVDLDFTDDPLDLSWYRKYNQISSWSLNNSLINAKYKIYIDKDSIIEYGKTVSATAYSSTYGNPDPEGSSYTFDEIDINDDGSTTDYVSKNTSVSTINTVSETSQSLRTTVKSDKDNYNNESKVSFNTQYTYKLRARTGTNQITNMVIYDSLEKYIKRGDTFSLASDGNESFQGLFMGVDTSYAESQGYNVKVYYSESEQPGSLESDTSWNAYTSSTDKSKVKSLAFEYLDSSGNKAIIPVDSLTYVEVIMKSPSKDEATGMRSYNGSWVEWNALDSTNNIIPDVVGINSNISSVSLPATLTVKHINKINGVAIADEEYYDNYEYGDSYTTSASTNIPANYEFKENAGDAPSGTISKLNTVVIYYYGFIEPTSTFTDEETFTESIDKRTNTVNYYIKVNYSIENYIGEYNTHESYEFEYDIDLSKSNLDGGVYDSSKKEVKWEKNHTIDSISKYEYEVEHQISVVFKNTPIDDRKISTYRVYGSNYTIENYHETSRTNFLDTSVNEQYKITVKHLEDGTNKVVAPEETYYKYYDDAYEYGISSELPANYQLKTRPDNYKGKVLAEETVITYLYEKKTPVLTSESNVIGTVEITTRNKPVNYKLSSTSTIKDYIGDGTVVETLELPYEIDTTKSFIDGGTYNNSTKKITWTKIFTANSGELGTIETSRDLLLVYKNIPISARNMTATYSSTISNDINSESSSATKDVAINEQYKIIVKHLEYGTNNVVAPEETYYKYYNDEYEYGISSELPGNYELKTTPSNYKGNVLSEETIITYLYQKKTPGLTGSVDITGPSEVSNRLDSFEYEITSNVTVKDYLGDEYVQTVLQLPYEIDLSKSNINGGTYSNTNKTITWIDNYNVLTSEEISFSKTHTISLVYKNIPIDKLSLKVEANSLIHTDINEKNVDNSFETTIKELYKIVVKHLEDGTNKVVASEETYYKYYNEEYEYGISSELPSNYKLKTRPDNYHGNVSLEETIITYLYEKKTPVLTSGLSVTGTESVEKRSAPVSYKITYNATIKDTLDPTNIKIVANLFNNIDLSNCNLDGGIYDSSTNTITWNRTVTPTTIEEQSLNYEFDISIVYKDVNISSDKYNFKVTTEIESLNSKDIKEKLIGTSILEKYKVIVKHLEYGTDNVIAPEEEFYKLYNETYTTDISSSLPDNYELKIRPTNYQGNVLAEETIVKYYYQLIDSTLTSEISSEYPEEVNSREEPIDITIKYKVKINSYIGDANIVIEDSLPYEIDEEKSNLDGGVYDKENKKLQWTFTEQIDSTDEHEVEYVLGIQIVFKDIDSGKKLINNVTGEVNLVNNSDSKETALITDVKIYGNIVINYVDEDNNVLDTVVSNGLINEEYIPVSIDIEGYNLVSTPELLTYKYGEEEVVLYYTYKKIEAPKIEIVEENPKTGVTHVWLFAIFPAILAIIYLITRKRSVFKKM